MKTLFFTLAALCYYGTLPAQIQIGNDIDGEAAIDISGTSVSMPDAHTVAIAGTHNDGNGTNSGHVRIYSLNNSGWNQKGSDIDGEASWDISGTSVSMPNANTVAIGAYHNDGNGTISGHVRIYTWDGSAWMQKGSDIDGEAARDLSGMSVSMPDANTVAIGAPDNDGSSYGSGHVRIYSWDGVSWIQKGSDIDGENSNDAFGFSVSMPDANTVAIGGRDNDGNGVASGHVRIYTWNGSSWNQKGGDIDGEAAGDKSGSLCMADANTVAIGAYNNSGSAAYAGHVRIYTWNGSAWVQKGGDIDGEAANDNSGSSVSMPDANTVAIGARKNNGNGTSAGHVRVYTWNGSGWNQQGVDIDGEAAGDHFGTSVSMPDNQTIAIGGPYNSNIGLQAGHVRVYSTCASIANISITACESYVWPQTGILYTTSGTYTDTATNAAGCDSIITLDLTITHSSSSTVNVSACDNYTWAQTGQAFTASGTYTDTLANAAGCDSVMTLNLIINSQTTSLQTTSACNSYSWRGNTFTTSGTYTDTISNAAGCDSVITLSLTIHGPTASSQTVSACNSYSWRGNTFNTSGTYTDTITNAGGCDSVITLNLTIHGPTASSQTVSACNSYSWRGNTFTSSGTYTDTVPNAAGCDSVMELSLTVTAIDTSVTVNSPMLQSDAVGPSYQWIDCGNGGQSIPGETGRTFIASVNGSYAVVLTQNACTDTSACYTVMDVSMEERTVAKAIFIYPNPSSGVFTVESQLHKTMPLSLWDLSGKQVLEAYIREGENLIDASKLSSGMYIIRYTAGSTEKTEKLIID